MVLLSVNVNKIATLRNARGQNLPCVEQVVEDLIHFGIRSITVHPRPDERHIKRKDVYEIKKILQSLSESLGVSLELNIEGYPSSSFLQLIKEVRPSQCTLVPDPPHVLTSNAGWKLEERKDFLQEVLKKIKAWNVRSSLFIDPLSFESENKEIKALEELLPDRVELYTENYARFFSDESKRKDILQKYRSFAEKLQEKSSLGFNAGHDLNASNLPVLLEELSFIQEVSIGHAFVCESLYEGLKQSTRKYLDICKKKVR